MFKIIIEDISNYMGSYFLKSIIMGLLCAFAMLCILTVFKSFDKEKADEKRIIIRTTAFFLWIVYGYMVLGITFLCRKPVFGHQLSLIPFTATTNNVRLMAYEIENILLFVPYGILIPALVEHCKKWFFCLIAGMVTSLSIETLQFMTMRGKAQMDDLLLNSAGTMIGWVIFMIVKRWFDKHILKEED